MLETVAFSTLARRARQTDILLYTDRMSVISQDRIMEPLTKTPLVCSPDVAHFLSSLPCEVASGIESLLASSGILPAPDDFEDNFVDRLRSAVARNLSNTLFGVEWLADEMCVSARHLQRLVGKAHGCSAAEYIRRARLQQAATLLVDRELPVSRVATLCGYRDAKYFATIFRRAYGLCPSGYRRYGASRRAPVYRGMRRKLAGRSGRDNYLVATPDADARDDMARLHAGRHQALRARLRARR